MHWFEIDDPLGGSESSSIEFEKAISAAIYVDSSMHGAEMFHIPSVFSLNLSSQPIEIGSVAKWPYGMRRAQKNLAKGKRHMCQNAQK